MRTRSTVAAVLVAALALSPSTAIALPSQQLTFSTPLTPDQLVRYTFQSKDDLRAFVRAAETNEHVDIWKKDLKSSSVDLRWRESGVSDSYLQGYEAEEKVLVDSIASLATSSSSMSRDHSDALLATHPSKAILHPSDDPIHQSYHPYENIIEILQNWVTEYGDEGNWAEMVSIAKTSEGRDVWGVRVGNLTRGVEEPEPEPEPELEPEEPEDSENGEFKKGKKQKGGRKGKGKKQRRKAKSGFVIVGGQHAREWIAPSTVLYLLHSIFLTSLPTNDHPVIDLSNQILTFVPLVNVDGYIYSWDTDRLWRKNRQPFAVEGREEPCYGLDLNRNWGYKWMAGNRPNPCSDAFAGEKAFQASELVGLSSYILEPKNNIVGFLDLHSFGQMIMFPYSYSCSKSTPDEENHYEAVVGASASLRRVHGRNFEVGSVCAVSLTGPGESVDWTYSVANVRWSFAMELRDYGVFAFLLPPDQIVPSGEETWAAFNSLSAFVADKERGGRFD